MYPTRIGISWHHQKKVLISRRWLLIGSQQKFSIHSPARICVWIPHKWLEVKMPSCDGEVDSAQAKSITCRKNTCSTHKTWWNLDGERIFSAHSSDRCLGGRIYLMRCTVASELQYPGKGAPEQFHRPCIHSLCSVQ